MNLNENFYARVIAVNVVSSTQFIFKRFGAIYPVLLEYTTPSNTLGPVMPAMWDSITAADGLNRTRLNRLGRHALHGHPLDKGFRFSTILCARLSKTSLLAYTCGGSSVIPRGFEEVQ